MVNIDVTLKGKIQFYQSIFNIYCQDTVIVNSVTIPLSLSMFSDRMEVMKYIQTILGICLYICCLELVIIELIAQY